MFENINWKRKFADCVQALFRSHGADNPQNDKKQRKIVEYCLNDIEQRPTLRAALLHSKNDMKYYILQCALECVEEAEI